MNIPLLTDAVKKHKTNEIIDINKDDEKNFHRNILQHLLEKLHPNYKPSSDSLSVREKHMISVKRFLYNALNTDYSAYNKNDSDSDNDENNKFKKASGLYICGPPGVGKSLTVGYICDQLATKHKKQQQQSTMIFIHINAMTIPNTKDIYKEIIKRIKESKLSHLIKENMNDILKINNLQQLTDILETIFLDLQQHHKKKKKRK